MGNSPPSPGHDPDGIPEATNAPGDRPRNSWIAPGASDVVDASQEAAPDQEHHRGRRILSRIPGLSRLSEQSGWAEGEAEPATLDEGWVFHEADGPEAFDGWLYHYADGTMVDADGVEYALPAATPAGPEAEPAPVPEPVAEETPHLSVVQTPPEPEPEAEPEPETEPAVEPTASAPATESTAEPAARPPDVPRFIEYSPTHVRGYLLGGVFVIASVTAVITLFVAVSDDSTAALVIAGGCIVLALVAWWALLGWKPTVVTIEEGVLEVSRGGHTEQFELTDPSTNVAFTGRPGSPSWAATVRNDNGPRTVLRSSHVKPRQFERIVRHYRTTSEAARPDDPSAT